jgi:hypothetical protein
MIITLSNSTHSSYIFSTNVRMPFVFDGSLVGVRYKYFVLCIVIIRT